mmetsp:Transcript_4507/g.17054  ORF Transcript_4507/g.17054 Transcript_4507/m.17054 type:complete len:100 (+) Transcript_4507:2059-2358(+)
MTNEDPRIAPSQNPQDPNNHGAPRHLLLSRAKQSNRTFFDSADHVLTNGKKSGVSVLKTNVPAGELPQGQILKRSQLTSGGKNDTTQQQQNDEDTMQDE